MSLPALSLLLNHIVQVYRDSGTVVALSHIAVADGIEITANVQVCGSWLKECYHGLIFATTTVGLQRRVQQEVSRAYGRAAVFVVSGIVRACAELLCVAKRHVGADCVILYRL